MENAVCRPALVLNCNSITPEDNNCRQFARYGMRMIKERMLEKAEDSHESKRAARKDRYNPK
jgi:hypothetical protein